VIQIFRDRERLRGLKLLYEAPVLRHFTARLEEIGEAPATPAGARAVGTAAGGPA